jgi:hypothetical protein
MQHISTETAVWIQFFKEASIPAEYIQNYAVKFTENRIRFDMLADLDRPLLNELGITAIGDCLSILKYAKSAPLKYDEKFKEIDAEKGGKTNQVAKRIIESCISKSPLHNSDSDSEKNSKMYSISKKTVNNKNMSSGGSSLSSGLFSRLNFNPSSKIQDRVISTTHNDESPKKVQKRRIDDDVSDVSDIDSDENSNRNRRSALEYRGLLKNSTEKTVIVLPNNKRVLSANEGIKLGNSPVSSLKRRISMEPITKTIKTSPIKSKITINRNFTKKNSPQNDNQAAKMIKAFGSLRSDFVNKPVLNRLNTNEPPKNISHIFNTQPKSSNESIKSRITGLDSPKMNKNQKITNQNFTITLNNDRKKTISPISFNTKKTVEKQPFKMSSIVRTVNNTNDNFKKREVRKPERNIYSRISM